MSSVGMIVGGVLTIVGSLIVGGLTIALVLRRRDDEPAFVPDRRWLAGAAVLVVVAGVLFPVAKAAASSRSYVGVTLTFYAVVALALAAFLVAGAGLRPRGRRGRGLLLGAAMYLLGGVVFLVLSSLLLSTTEPLSHPMWLLTWPGVVLVVAGVQF